MRPDPTPPRKLRVAGRDRIRPDTRAAGPGPVRASVIGGGVAGLATAVLLARAGATVDLFERNGQLGGRAGVLTTDGFTFDTGPSWYLMPEVFDHFFNLAGSSTDRELDLVALDPGYRVFDESGTQTLTVPRPNADSANIRELFEALEPGSGLGVHAYLESATDTYRLALGRFLYTNFDSYSPLASRRVLRRLPRLPGLLAGSLAGRIDRTVTHPLLRQVLGYPAVFLGTSPDRAPALYHLMSHLDLVDGVRYPMGGMHRLVDALERLARAAGVRIHLNAEAVAVAPARRPVARPGLAPGPGPEGTASGPGQGGMARDLGRPRWRPVWRPAAGGARFGAGWGAESLSVRTPAGMQRFETDVLVSAGDKHHFDTRLLPRWARSETAFAWERKDPGIGALVLMLGVRGRLPQLAHHNLFFAADWEKNFRQIFAQGRLADPASAYVCAPSVTDPSVTPAGCENLFVLVPAPADPGLKAGQRAVEAYGDRIVDGIGARIGVPGLRSRVVTRTVLAPGDYTRLYHAWHGTALGPANTLLQSAMFRGGPRNPRLDNVFYAGTYAAPGVGLPLALISAINVVKALAGDRSAGAPGPELLERLRARWDARTRPTAGSRPAAAPRESPAGPAAASPASSPTPAPARPAAPAPSPGTRPVPSPVEGVPNCSETAPGPQFGTPSTHEPGGGA